MNGKDGLLDYEAMLADLETKRAAIERAIETVRPLVLIQTGASGEFRGMTIQEAAKIVLKTGPKNTKELLKALKQGGLHYNYASVVSVLERIAVKKTGIKKIGRGIWELDTKHTGTT